MHNNSFKRLALFDLDHTLLPLDSDYHWAQYLAKAGHVGDPKEALQRNQALMDKYNAGTLTADETYSFMLGLLTYGDEETLKRWHADYMKAVILPAIHKPAIDLLGRHRDQGDVCVIVTATNEFVTAPIARRFGFEHLIATVPEQKEGRFTGRVEGIPSYQEGKITRVDQWLSAQARRRDQFERIWFYSDSINDLPLMQVVSDPIATNPCAQLRAHAIDNQWEILDLFTSEQQEEI